MPSHSLVSTRRRIPLPFHHPIHLHLREKTEADREFVYHTLKQNMLAYMERHFHGWDDASFEQRWQEIPSLIIESKGNPVGFLSMREKEPQVVHLHEFHIRKDHQNQGIGGRILTTICQTLQNQNVQKIQLHVFKDNPALEFYKRHGFQIIGEGHLGTNWLICKIL